MEFIQSVNFKVEGIRVSKISTKRPFYTVESTGKFGQFGIAVCRLKLTKVD